MRHFWTTLILFSIFSIGCEKDKIEIDLKNKKRAAPALTFAKRIKEYVRGGRFSTQEILQGVKGDKSGYTLKSISTLSPNDIVNVGGTAPDLQLDFNKAGAFTATLVLEHKTRADVSLERASFEIKDAPALTFAKRTKEYVRGGRFSTQEILQGVKGDKSGYTLKSISTLSPNDIVNVGGTAPDLQLDFNKVGAFTATLVLEHRTKADVSLERASFEIKRFITFDKTFHGTATHENINQIIQTSDEGYAFVGYRTTSNRLSTADFWVVKLDALGNITWEKKLGGDKRDIARSITQTADGGYIVVGETESKGAGNDDAWVVKLDGDGNQIWDKTFGGAEGDAARRVLKTNDGFVIVGVTGSKGAGDNDAWVIKLDASGNRQWDKTFGTSNTDMGVDIVVAHGGGYVFLGKTYGKGLGLDDMWLVKLDATGNQIWDKTFGAASFDYGKSLVKTNDGGYALLGESTKVGSGVNLYLAKVDASGVKIWDKEWDTLLDDEYAGELITTKDGGFAIVGFTPSKGAGANDLWLLKLDDSGAQEWEKVLGGRYSEYGRSLVQTKDGGFMVAGVKQINQDAWLLKLNEKGNL